MTSNGNPYRMFICIAICTMVILITPQSNHGEVLYPLFPDKKNNGSYNITKEILKIVKSPTEIKAEANHTATVIFLHDYGESSTDWAERIHKIVPPYMKVVVPQANMMNIGWKNKQNITSWFNFTGHEFPEINVQTIDDEFQKAINYVHKLINTETYSGIKPGRIVIAGIAQGAVLALHAASSFPERLGGIVSLSTWDPIEKTFDRQFQIVNKHIPIFQTHTSGNPYSTREKQKSLYKDLRKYITAIIELHLYKGDSKICDEELSDIGKFFAKHF